MIGAKTIGHAILLVFDGGPLLATDPWLGGRGAFFGSWQLSHPVPPTELAELRSCRYVWISHGHPDHLCLDSLETLRHAEILLPAHRGRRVARELAARGFGVRELPDRRWVDLSPRVRICSIADFMQNAILLADVNGRLFVDLNDASDRGWGVGVREAVARFRRSFLLKLAPTGNLGVLNLRDEQGELQLGGHAPERAGEELSAHADRYGVTHVVPFSSFHTCQRTDSAWANPYLVTPEVFARSFASKTGAELLSPFLEIDCERDAIREIAPPRAAERLLEPEAFGDRWSDELERDDVTALASYLERKEALRERVGFVTFRVGGKEHRLELNAALQSGVTIETPRQSLMTAVREQIFDDLLLGHFAKVTLHGLKNLGFLPVITRYADAGGVEKESDVDEYLADYRERTAVAIDEQTVAAVEALQLLDVCSAERVRPSPGSG